MTGRSNGRRAGGPGPERTNEPEPAGPPAERSAPAGGRAARAVTEGWRRADRAAGGLALDLGLYALSTAFAAVTARTSTLTPHRAWAALAVWGYAAATVAVLGQLAVRRFGPTRAGPARFSPARFGRARHRPVTGVRAGLTAMPGARAGLTALAWAATTLLPLLVQAVQRAGGRPDRAQEEVLVVEQAGQRLVETGTPYLDRAAIAALPEPERLLGYFPYQPGMALFGLPRATFGEHWWTDARPWFALATLAAVAAALAIAGGRLGPLVRAGQAVTVLPLCALTLATGGDDLPVLALCLLALALAGRGRWGWAGVAVGAAGALKLFAWPVALVLAVHALTHGPAAARRFVGWAAALPAAALVPALLVDLGAAAENVLRFPLGQGLVTSPAQSPLPGHLIATGVPGGRAIAAALLVVAGLAIAAGLARRPPRTAAAATLVCAYGLFTAMLLLPSTRFGYLLYPVAFAAWAPALGAYRITVGEAEPAATAYT
ncbi:MAG TPA: glycosyltransferase 87 family protein [Micromonosporaceae bacterium]|nr:glycosyltransferase 87 family protein [Micromonosporaceae bacterium]